MSDDLVTRYAAGGRAWDDLYTQGERCPSNLEGAKCKCLIADTKMCIIWQRLEELAQQIGGTIRRYQTFEK